MASLADNLKTRRASELEHRGRPKIDLSRAKDSVGKMDRAVASLADLLPRMNEGGRLAYDESGNIVGGYDPEAQVEKAINWLMPMGSVAEAVDTGKGIAQGVLKTFGGVGAKTADKEALAAAEALEKSGADMRDIWRQTGYFRAPWDGKWRWEIDDSRSMFTREPKLPFKGTNVGHFLSHDSLYDAYPDAARWHLNPSNPSLVGLKGQTSYGDMIDLNPEAGADTLQHEIQHAIQDREGFARGGSPDGMELEYNNARARLNYLENEPEYLTAQQQIDDAWNRALFDGDLSVDDAAALESKLTTENPAITEANRLINVLRRYEGNTLKDFQNAYMRLAGEAEARLVQDRLPLTAAQRREQYPLDGLAAMLAREGIDPGQNFENLITRYGDGPAMSVEPDLSRFGIGAPELRAASDNSLAATLERMRARNLEKGLDEDMSTGAVRDEIARRNGVAMLGLPEEHTAMDRARVMFPAGAYHGTNSSFSEFSPEMRGASTQARSAKLADWATNNPQDANHYADLAAKYAPTDQGMLDSLMARTNTNNQEMANIAASIRAINTAASAAKERGAVDELAQLSAQKNYLMQRRQQLEESNQDLNLEMLSVSKNKGQNVLPLQVQGPTLFAQNPQAARDEMAQLERQHMANVNASNSLTSAFDFAGPSGNIAKIKNDLAQIEQKYKWSNMGYTALDREALAADPDAKRLAAELTNQESALEQLRKDYQNEAARLRQSAADSQGRLDDFNIQNFSTLDARNALPPMMVDGISGLLNKASPGTRVIQLNNMKDPHPGSTHYAILDPKGTVRSRFAAFDPARRDSANLLASLSGAAVLAPSLADYLDRR